MESKQKISSHQEVDTLDAMAQGLAHNLDEMGAHAEPGMIAQALGKLLCGQDKTTKQMRAAVQIYLALVSNGALKTNSCQVRKTDDFIATEEAALLMGCSRPHVAMLIDAGKLAGGVRSKGGHRKVPKASVMKWLKETKRAAEATADDKDYRKAAVDGGFYDIPDEAFAKAAKRRARAGA